MAPMIDIKTIKNNIFGVCADEEIRDRRFFKECTRCV
jgi:hypothetical protein